MRNTMVKLKMLSLPDLLTKQKVPVFSCLQFIYSCPLPNHSQHQIRTDLCLSITSQPHIWYQYDETDPNREKLY